MEIPEKGTQFVAIASGTAYTVGLRADRTAAAIGYDDDRSAFEQGENIVGIAASNAYMIGIKANGQAVICGHTELGREKIVTWIDVVDISADMSQAVALKAAGTVCATGFDLGDEFFIENVTITPSDLPTRGQIGKNGKMANECTDSAGSNHYVRMK